MSKGVLEVECKRESRGTMTGRKDGMALVLRE